MACVLRQIFQSAVIERFAILAHCFMPDHLHLVVRGTDKGSHLPSFMKRAKQTTAYQFRRAHGIALWSTGYFERILDEDAAVQEAVRYVMQNPVAAGLVPSADDYPFSADHR